MWKKGLIAGAGLLLSLCVTAQELEPIKLSSPDLKREVSLMHALQNRASTRSFSDSSISNQLLSDLLWAANGVNRPEKGGRTAPSAIGAKDIDLYVIRAEGVYRYDAAGHVLKPVKKGDFRAQIGGQDYVQTAPVNLLLVSDLSRFERGDEALKETWAAMDAGVVSQNISLFCSATGLATVPRAMINYDQMRKALDLKEDQKIMLNHPVGYPE